MLSRCCCYGRVAEWLKAPVLKTGRGSAPSWVRIPPLPPISLHIYLIQLIFLQKHSSAPLVTPHINGTRRTSLGDWGPEFKSRRSDQPHNDAFDFSQVSVPSGNSEAPRVHKGVHRRVLRMVRLGQDARGNYKARKRIPADVSDGELGNVKLSSAPASVSTRLARLLATVALADASGWWLFRGHPELGDATHTPRKCRRTERGRKLSLGGRRTPTPRPPRRPTGTRKAAPAEVRGAPAAPPRA